MDSSERIRYACQIALPGFGEAAQDRLKASRVLVVGLGGLGCPAAQYLVAAGVGQISLVDFDTVSVSNLHRQILYKPHDVGQPKAHVAATRLSEQNPHVTVRAVVEKISTENALELLTEHDLVLDCSDNFETRYLINDAAVLCNKPVVYGAIYQYEGQVALWNTPNTDGSRSPHYRDLFPEVEAAQVPNCAEGGIIPSLAGIIGCIQANEAIKYLTGTDQTLAGRLMVFDAAAMQSRIFKIGHRSRVLVTTLPEANPLPTVTQPEWAAAQPHTYMLVDVRNTDERAVFNLGGLHIPLPELAERLEELPDDRPVLFYCATGRRSAEAVRIWQKHKPERAAFSLKNGIR